MSEVYHDMNRAVMLDTADGGSVVVAPAKGHLFRELDKPAALYLAVEEDNNRASVTLTKAELRRVLAYIDLVSH